MRSKLFRITLLIVLSMVIVPAGLLAFENPVASAQGSNSDDQKYAGAWVGSYSVDNGYTNKLAFTFSRDDLALLLAGVGVYGVMAYAVAQHTHEIGVRMALGARGRDVFRLVVGQALKLTVVGLAIGLPVALALGQLMAGALFGIVSLDALTYVGFTLLLTTVALLAGYLPARRAMRVDPLVTLRHE